MRNRLHLLVETAPDQFTTAIEQRYQKAFSAGMAEGEQRYAAGSLRYPIDMPKQLQVGLYADQRAREYVIAYAASIGVQEGAGQILSMNRWFYDPAGTGLYTRPDVLLNYGFGAMHVLDGKTTIYQNIISENSIRYQFNNYYRYGAATVKAVTGNGIHPMPPLRMQGR